MTEGQASAAPRAAALWSACRRVMGAMAPILPNARLRKVDRLLDGACLHDGSNDLATILGYLTIFIYFFIMKLVVHGKGGLDEENRSRFRRALSSGAGWPSDRRHPQGSSGARGYSVAALLCRGLRVRRRERGEHPVLGQQ